MKIYILLERMLSSVCTDMCDKIIENKRFMYCVQKYILLPIIRKPFEKMSKN